MPLLIRCPACDKALKVKEELAGKKVKCPGCGKPVPVPAPEPPPEVVEEVEEVVEKVVAAPAKKQAKASAAVKAKPDEEEVPAADMGEEEPAAEKKGKGDKWVPCPSCGATGPRRVKYTFWGSYYGPKLFNHVRCQQCGTAYNGKTGGSNLIPAIIFITVPAIGIILLLGVIGFILWYKGVFG
jgi:hypothetical protein